MSNPQQIPPTGPPQAPYYGQPAPHGHPGPYGHPGYRAAYPGYGIETPDPAGRANPLAGVLLLIGVVIAAGGFLIPYNLLERHGAPLASPPLVAGIDYIRIYFFGSYGFDIEWQGLVQALCPIVLALGALLCLIAAFGMFGVGRHKGSAITGTTGAILALVAALLLVAPHPAFIFEHPTITVVLIVIAWIPALIGAILGFRKR